MNKRKEAIYEDKTKDAIQETIDYGLDVNLLYERLTLSPTERKNRKPSTSTRIC